MVEKQPDILTSEMPGNTEISASSVLVGNFVDPKFEDDQGTTETSKPQENIYRFLDNDDEGPMAESIFISNNYTRFDKN